jgi:hypothetical protein
MFGDVAVSAIDSSLGGETWVAALAVLNAKTLKRSLHVPVTEGRRKGAKALRKTLQKRPFFKHKMSL